MKRFVLFLFLLATAPSIANAQTPTPAGPNYRLEWDTLLPTGQTITQYSHFVSIDGATPVPLVRTCDATAGPNGLACRAPFPAMTPGVHALRVVARATLNGITVEAPEAPPTDRVQVNILVAVGATGVRVIASLP